MNEDAPAIAVIASKIDHITESVSKIERQLETNNTVYVTRSEWNLQKQLDEERHANARSERESIRDSARQQESRKAPWWAVVASIGGIIAAVALVIDMFGPFAP